MYTIFLVKSFMFAASRASSTLPLLCSLRVLCAMRDLCSNLEPKPVTTLPILCSPTLSSLFSRRSEKLNSLFSILCALFQKEYFRNHPNLNHLRTLLQNTGGGVPRETESAYSLSLSSTTSHHSTHTNDRNSLSFMRLLHSSRHTWRWGVYRLIQSRPLPSFAAWGGSRPWAQIRSRTCTPACLRATYALFKIANVALQVRSWGGPSARLCVWIPAGSPSIRSTTWRAGPHRQSTSNAGCASILRPAGSSFPGPVAGTFSRRCEKPTRAGTNSRQPRNQSGREPA